MVVDSLVVSAGRDSTSIWPNARAGGGLVTAARRSLVDLVALRDSSPRSSAPGWNSRHDESREEASSYRENTGPHGEETIDRSRGTVRGYNHFFEHLSRWSSHHGIGRPRRSALLNDLSHFFSLRWRTEKISVM